MSLLIYFNSFFPPIQFVQGFFQEIFSSPKAYLYGIKSSDTQTLTEKKLREENKKLLERVKDYAILKKDNTALRSQFEETTLVHTNLLAARVVGFKGQANASHTLVLDKGQDHGVRQNLTVVSGKIFVGRVKSVTKHYSTVELPVSREFSTLGKTLTHSATGIISGEEDFILFDRVDVREKVTEGELVVTRGEVEENGAGIVGDLIVGKVTSLRREESAPFQSAKVEPVIQYLSLTLVFIIKQ